MLCVYTVTVVTGFLSDIAGATMQASTSHALLRTVSFVILVLMIGAIIYAAYISAAYWSGIGV
jgi:hypothetical protein